MEMNRPPYAVVHPHVACNGREHLQQQLDQLVAVGAEGIMLRQPGSVYEAGRSATLLKCKRFLDGEARVIGHEPGKGKHKGRLGALLVEMENGVRFSVGTGFTDAQRASPVPIGSIITFRFQELSDRHVPRFPSFVGVRGDDPQLNHFGKGEDMASNSRRRFEFVGGNSSKFWEIVQRDNRVTVQFGRIGTAGQAETKTFGDANAAHKHVEKKIAEKLKKGYSEVA
jgi:DNA ligase 1